jgi:hypothetical protein
LVPSIATVAITPLLLLAVWSSFSTTDVIFMLKITFVLLLSIALSAGYEYIEEKYLALIQCCMAIGVAFLMVRLMQQMRRDLLERTLLLLWCLIVTGSILETLGVIRDLSDSFRVWAYEAVFGLYDREWRDINLVGWVRPKLFSAEPSHVTKFFIATVNSWLLVNVTWRKVAIVAGATIVMLVIMGSPALFVSAAITVLIVLWNRRENLRKRIAALLVIFIMGAIFGAYDAGSRFSNVTSRLETIDAGFTQESDLGSEEKRFVYPYMVLASTWLRWPLFGVGIGGKEVVFENAVFAVSDPQAALGGNALAETGVYLGLLGGVLYAYTLLSQARYMGVHRLILLAMIVALFSQLLSGMVTFRYWGFIALFWGAVAVADIQAKSSSAVPEKNVPNERDFAQGHRGWPSVAIAGQAQKARDGRAISR